MRISPRVSGRVVWTLLWALSWISATAILRADDEPNAGSKGTVAKPSRRGKPSLPKKPAARSKRFSKKASPKAVEAKADPATPPSTAPVADDKTLKFTRDVAPILVANCMPCHNPQQKRGKFDLTTFRKLMDGAEDGKVIVPGNTEESKLVEMVETREMPRGNQRRLSDEAIARITAWVKAGALLDAGVDPNAPLDKIAAKPEELKKAALAKLNDSERDRLVETTGLERLKKASASAAPQVTKSRRFMLFSNLPEPRRDQLLKVLENRLDQLKKWLGTHADKALDPKFKISLYVFNDANGYVEFVRTIENREVEAGTEGHANLGVDEPYLAAIDPLNGRDDPFLIRKPARTRKKVDEQASGPERNLAGLLTEQLAVGLIARAEEKAPRWLTFGLAAYLASPVEPRSSPYLRKLRLKAFEQFELGWIAKSNQALGDDLEEEKLRAVGFSLVEWMAVEPALRPMFGWFVVEMLQGKERLDDVVKQGFGPQATREGFLELWGEWIASHYGRIR